jgi:CheY-like chemotaxis protein
LTLMRKEMNEPKVGTDRPKAGHRGLIYVVDDEPMLLELASAMLEPLGCEIVTFRDPETALKTFASADPPPDVLITDYAMPAMNGLALLSSCRRIHLRQKVLLVSGTVDESFYQDTADRPDLFLAKPYQGRQLVKMVKSLLETSSSA